MSRKIDFSGMYDFIDSYMTASNKTIKLRKERISELKPLLEKKEDTIKKRNEYMKKHNVSFRDASDIFPFESMLLENIDEIDEKYNSKVRIANKEYKFYRGQLPDSLYHSYVEMIANFKEKSGKHELNNGEVIKFKAFSDEVKDLLTKFRASYVDNDKAISKFTDAIKVVIGAKVKLSGNNKLPATFTKTQFYDLFVGAVAVYGERLKYWSLETNGNIKLSVDEVTAKNATNENKQ